MAPGSVNQLQGIGGISAAPWLQTGAESKNYYFPNCVTLSLLHSCFSVFMRSKLKVLQCGLTGLLFFKIRVQAWTGYYRQHFSCDKTALSTLNAPMNFRKQALSNPGFSTKILYLDNEGFSFRFTFYLFNGYIFCSPFCLADHTKGSPSNNLEQNTKH